LQQGDLGRLADTGDEAVRGAWGAWVLAVLVNALAHVTAGRRIAREAGALAVVRVFAECLAHLLALHVEDSQLRLQQDAVIMFLGGTA